MDADQALREAAIRHVRSLSAQWGEAVPAAELTRGFTHRGARVSVVAWGRGIFKPKELTDGPLTLVSSLASSYADEHVSGADEMLYDYAPASTDEWANAGLKNVAALDRPVVLLKQVKGKPGSEYAIFAPVYITSFDDVARKMRLSLSASERDIAGVPTPQPSAFSKRYAETISKARLHQAHFRRDTLAAYGDRCCVCELRERPLLDAAHIVDDRLPEGMATVANGLAMCPTHHRAYDRFIISIEDDYRVRVERGRLSQPDSGPTAAAIVAFDGKTIWLPRNRSMYPAIEFLRQKRTLSA